MTLSICVHRSSNQMTRSAEVLIAIEVKIHVIYDKNTDTKTVQWTCQYNDGGMGVIVQEGSTTLPPKLRIQDTTTPLHTGTTDTNGE